MENVKEKSCSEMLNSEYSMLLKWWFFRKIVNLKGTNECAKIDIDLSMIFLDSIMELRQASFYF